MTAGSLLLDRAPSRVVSAPEWATCPELGEFAETGAGLDDQVEAWLREQTVGAVGTTAVANTVRVQDLPEEARIQAEFAHGLGALAIGGMVERRRHEDDLPDTHITGLRTSLEQAARGQTSSLASNVMASQTEALTNVGVMPDIHITVGSGDRLQQGGQSLYSVAKNTIEQHPGDHASLHEMAQVEGVNYHAFEVLRQAGYFQRGYVWVVPRLAPRQAPGSSIRQYGYFENFAVSWSFIWQSGPDQFTLRPMFTAGVDPQASEEVVDRKMTEPELDAMYDARQQRRHDIRAVGGIYSDYGLPVPATEAEFARGFLKHMDSFQDPNHPEATIGTHYDKQLGPDYHQGYQGRQGDYIHDAQVRAEALRELHQVTPQIIQQLVAERDQLTTDMAVADRMAALVRQYAIDYVIDHPQYTDILGPALGLAALQLLHEGPKTAAGEAGNGNWRAMIHDVARAQLCGFDTAMMVAIAGSDWRGPLAFVGLCGHLNVREAGGTLKEFCDKCGASTHCE